MAFKGRSAATSPPPSPEALHRDLPRKPGAVPGLWLHQGDILRAYASDHADTPDLALELPTGTSKTLPGLLITDWVRRVRSARVVYACPIRQLARPVARTAEREGMPAEVLVGSSRDWPLDAQTRYEAAEALAIVTYSTVFNSSPKPRAPARRCGERKRRWPGGAVLASGTAPPVAGGECGPARTRRGRHELRRPLH